jgi:hypothetical protein
MWNDDDIFCEGQLSLFEVSEPEKADPPDWLQHVPTMSSRRVSARWAWDEGVE